MAQNFRSLQAPYQDSIAQKEGRLSRPWEMFFRYLQELVEPLGAEQSIALSNNQTDELIPGLMFDKRRVSLVFFEFVIQRVSDSDSGVFGGSMVFGYDPFVDQWAKLSELVPGINDTATTLSLGADGKMKYSSGDWPGIQKLFLLRYRYRTLSGAVGNYA